MSKKLGGTKLKGGAGAAEYVASVFGGPSQQTAQLNESNQLKPVVTKGGSCGVPLVQGGSPLAQIAVPAVLLVANNRFGKTKKSFKKFKMGKRSVRFPKSRKFRGSRAKRSGKR